MVCAGRITRTSVLVGFTFLLVGCETAEQKAQRIEAERQAQAQAQAQKVEAELREKLGDKMAVAVVHWIAPGEVIEGSGPLPTKVSESFEQRAGFKRRDADYIQKGEFGLYF
jgi:hypothetical protein